MFLTGDQIHRTARLGIKIGVVGLAAGIDGHQNPLIAIFPLKDQLPGLYHDIAIAAQAERLAAGAGFCQRRNPGGQLVLFRLFDGRAQGGIAVFLVPLHPPLAAVVDRRGAGHAKEQAVDGRQAVLVIQNGGDPGHIVVVHKAQQMLSGVQAPRFGSKLAIEAVGNLVHISGVEAGIQPLVAFVIGHRVAGMIVHPAVVIAVKGLTHQSKLRL